VKYIYPRRLSGKENVVERPKIVITASFFLTKARSLASFSKQFFKKWNFFAGDSVYSKSKHLAFLHLTSGVAVHLHSSEDLDVNISKFLENSREKKELL